MSLTAATFLLLYMSGLIASIVRHPIFGLYTYMLAFFVAPKSHWWGNDLPSVRWLFIAAAVALVSTFLRKPESVYPPWFSNGGGRLVLLFVLWMWLQTTWAIVPLDTQLEGAELFTKHLITFILVYRIVNTPERLRAFSLAFVAGIAYFGYEALGESGRLEDVGGSVSNANTLGFYASAGLLFASFLFLGVKGKNKMVGACLCSADHELRHPDSKSGNHDWTDGWRVCCLQGHPEVTTKRVHPLRHSRTVSVLHVGS